MIIHYLLIFILLVSLVIEIIFLQTPVVKNDEIRLVPREVNPLVYDPRVYKRKQ